MAKQHPVAAQAEAACRETIEALGVDLLETVFVREEGRWFLRFYIDKRGGVSMDDCVAVTEAIDPLIDESVTYKGNYHLEVSSPGVDRPLKNHRDLERHLGDWVEVSLYQPLDGQKKHVGQLVSVDEADTIVMETESGKTLTLTAAERAKLTQAIRF